MVVKKFNQKGIGLVEVVAALGISVVVLTSLVSLSLFTLRSSLQSKLALEGTKLANRELELVRAFRDGNAWADFALEAAECNDENSACHMSTTPPITISAGQDIINDGSADQLTRFFFITNPDGTDFTSTNTQARVTVEVNWAVGDETKFTRLYTDLTNWNDQ